MKYGEVKILRKDVTSVQAEVNIPEMPWQLRLTDPLTNEQ